MSSLPYRYLNSSSSALFCYNKLYFRFARLEDVGAPLKEVGLEVTNRSDEPVHANNEIKNEEEKGDKKPVSKKARRNRLLSRSDNEGDVPMKKKK